MRSSGPAAVDRDERARRRLEKEAAATNAAETVYGDAALTADAYWQSKEAASAWGVLEVNTGIGEGAYYATSVFWGVADRATAELLAAFCNTVHRAYDPLRHRMKQFAVFGAPPCTVTVAIAGARALHLALTTDFPVRHQPQRWVETTLLAQDYYLYDAKQEHGVQDAHLIAHMTRTFFAVANRALPVAFFDAQSAGCFVKPEGLEARALTSGDTEDARLATADPDPDVGAAAASNDDDDDDAEEEEEEKDEGAVEAGSDSDSGDAMDFDE
jgi:hypothetical protein